MENQKPIQIFGLPKYINEKYMVELDADSLKNLCNTNREVKEFCQRNEIWKKKFKRDFDKSLPEYLDEPDWMRVYYWFQEKHRLEQDFKFGVKTENTPGVGLGHSLFLDIDSVDFCRNVGSLMTLGAKSKKGGYRRDNSGGHVYLHGLYKDYPFTISNWYDKNIFMVCVALNSFDRLFPIFMANLYKYILMTEPITFNIIAGDFGLVYDTSDVLFWQDIPNSARINVFEYLYKPEFTINEHNVTDETLNTYIDKILMPLEPILIGKGEDMFFDFIVDGGYDLKHRTYQEHYEAFGVYAGIPFFVYSKEGDDSLYCKCPAKNVQPLVSCLQKLLRGFEKN